MIKSQLLIIFGLLVAISCEKPEQKQDIFLTKTVYHTNNNMLIATKNYTYSNEGKLIKWEYYYNAIEPTDSDKLVLYENFYYSKDQLDSSLRYSRISGLFTVTSTRYFTFDSENKPSTIVYNDFDAEKNTFKYHYNNQFLDSLEFEKIYNNGRDTVNGYFKIATDNRGNIISRQKYILSTGYSNDILPENYQYDEKVNPFQYMNPTNDFEYFSPNNMTMDIGQSYRYDYNSMGLPVKEYRTDLQTSFVFTVVDYIYSEH